MTKKTLYQVIAFSLLVLLGGCLLLPNFVQKTGTKNLGSPPEKERTPSTIRSTTVDFRTCSALKDMNLYGKDFEDTGFIVAGEEGVIFRSKMDFLTEFSVSPDNLALLQQFDGLLKDRGTQLVLAVIPTRGIAAAKALPPDTADNFNGETARKNYRALLSTLNESGIITIGTPETRSGINYFNRADQHWTKAGAQEMAQAIAERVHVMPAYTTVEKKIFKTTIGQETTFEGSFNKILFKLCGYKASDETDVEANTFPVAEISENDLLGNQTLPSIAIVGTSNSKKENNDPNFAGALKEALSADVYNAAVTGGGLDDSIVAFLQSDFFRTSPPKILIWEFPAYYDLASGVMEKTLRQTIPTVLGRCQNPVFSKTGVRLSNKKNILLSSSDISNFDWKNYYFLVSFDQPVRQNFSIGLKNITNHSIKLGFKKGRDPMKDYAYAPPDIKEIKELTMTIQSKNIGGVVDIQICPR